MSDYMAQLLQNPPDSIAKVRLIERLEDSRDNACLERSTFHKLFSDCIVALAERDARIAALEAGLRKLAGYYAQSGLSNEVPTLRREVP